MCQWVIAHSAMREELHEIATTFVRIEGAVHWFRWENREKNRVTPQRNLSRQKPTSPREDSAPEHTALYIALVLPSPTIFRTPPSASLPPTAHTLKEIPNIFHTQHTSTIARDFFFTSCLQETRAQQPRPINPTRRSPQWSPTYSDITPCNTFNMAPSNSIASGKRARKKLRPTTVNKFSKCQQYQRHYKGP